jgi:hypothetical protein
MLNLSSEAQKNIKVVAISDEANLKLN